MRFAFLRGINVGGHRVTNVRLVELFEAAGATRVATFQAAGNVVLDDSGPSRAELEAVLAHGLGYDVPVYLRSAAELADVATGGPFAGRAIPADASLFVTFLQNSPDANERRLVEAASTDVDELRVVGRELYWFASRRFAGSLVDWKALTRAIPDPGTNRNITTIRKLAARYAV